MAAAMRTNPLATAFASLTLTAGLFLGGCTPLATQLGNPTHLPGGRSPTSVVAADLNGDGKQDLVLARAWGRGEVAILLGRGDGTFGNPVQLVGSGAPKAPCIADLNGDGKPDLAISDFSAEGTVSVLLGNGDGTFREAVTHVIGRSATSVKAADLNGDGKLDLVAVNTRPESNPAAEEIAGKLVFMAGHGDGTFEAARLTNLSGTPRGVTLGDWDGDGKMDAMIAVSYGTLSQIIFMRGQGDGSFVDAQRIASTFETLGVAPPVDLDKDGKADLVVGVESGTTVYLSNGDGTFRNVADYYTEITRSSFAVDLDRDGNMDIVTGRRFLKGDGTGHFKQSLLPHTYNDDAFVTVADFNGDGWPDVAAADMQHNQIDVFLNVGGPAPVKTARR